MSTKAISDKPGCLARSIAGTFATEPTLEAVTINEVQEKISVATLGRVDEDKLAMQVTKLVERAQTDFPCGLLIGKEDCVTCAAPLTTAEREKLAVQRHGDATTIARVTCPTAPKFWRWKNFPLPKFAPRSVELFIEHEHESEDVHEHHHQKQAARLLDGLFWCGYT